MEKRQKHKAHSQDSLKSGGLGPAARPVPVLGFNPSKVANLNQIKIGLRSEMGGHRQKRSVEKVATEPGALRR